MKNRNTHMVIPYGFGSISTGYVVGTDGKPGLAISINDHTHEPFKDTSCDICHEKSIDFIIGFKDDNSVDELIKSLEKLKDFVNDKRKSKNR